MNPSSVRTVSPNPDFEVQNPQTMWALFHLGS